MEHSDAVQPDAHLDRLFLKTDLEEPWYKSIVRGIRETVSPPKLPPLVVTSKPVEDDLGDLSKIEQSWFKSLASNIHDLVRPPKLPPLEVTSKPVEVGTIWGAYQGGGRKSGVVSVLVHVGVVVLLLVVFQSPAVRKKAKDLGQIIYLPAYQPKLPPAAEKSAGGGGGGQKMPQPVDHGAPPKFDRKPFVPPALAVPKPVLPVTPTITAPIPQIQADNYGDPLSKIMQNSGGQGANGLGSGTGGGLGSGNGNGYGPDLAAAWAVVSIKSAATFRNQCPSTNPSRNTRKKRAKRNIPEPFSFRWSSTNTATHAISTLSVRSVSASMKKPSKQSPSGASVRP